jgi:hypothetical protein
MNTSEIRIGEKHLSLYKGAPGTGKSIAAHSFHVLGPTYTFDFDEKMDAVAGAYKGVNFEYDQFEDVFKAMDRLADFRRMSESGRFPYKSIIWDGWHTFAMLALKSVLAVRAPGKKRNVSGNIERYQIEDYGSEGRALDIATDDLKALYRNGVNIITVAHWRRIATYNIISKREEVVEGLFIPGGKIAFAVPIPYNELYWFSVESDLQGNSHQFMAETTGIHETKTVLKVSPKINWTKKNFYETLMSEHEKEMKVISL